ncbi:ABC transporter permease [Nicoliella lavandulae]|uniref:ABC transporter permease n=1 Tax=Nicoliella lavandulae TaxID=3082954 RepID=A0ABU8SK87_9LACO
MLSLLKRNLKLYFANRTMVFFSMLAALISFVLYLLFLKTGMQQEWQHIPGNTKLLDPWLISGTLAVAGLTSTGTALSQMVTDRETGRIYDLKLTDLSTWQIQSSYLISAMLVGIINQMVAFGLMGGYFQLVDNINIGWGHFDLVLAIAIGSSLVWTSFNLLIYSFINRVKSISTVNSIIGTASGFFAGTYVPIGTLPSIAQTVMKCTPAPYVSAAFRQVLMDNQLSSSFKHLPTTVLKNFRLSMGVDIKLGSTVLSMAQIILLLSGFLLLFIVLLIIVNYLRRKEVLVHAG